VILSVDKKKLGVSRKWIGGGKEVREEINGYPAGARKRVETLSLLRFVLVLHVYNIG
jgi:hypothetical protein